MTANRWWVKKIARWMAKVNASSSIAQLGLLGITGVSTLGSMLTDYGFGDFFLPIILTLLICYIIFTELFTEGGVWNEVNKNKSELGRDHATPIMRIDDEMIAGPIVAGMKGRPLNEKERTAIAIESNRTYFKHLNGMDLQVDYSDFDWQVEQNIGDVSNE